MKNRIPLLLLILFSACSQSKKADLILYNAKVYTVDDNFTITEAISVKDGKILETGTTDFIRSKYTSDNEIDAKGRTVYPGFIDGHAHFFNYGSTLQQADLTATKSWKEILAKLVDFSKNHKDGWLMGRGWDQNDWSEKSFPDNAELSRLFPDRPVCLIRVDGHAAVINDAAIKISGLKPGQKLTGGEVEVVNGKLTGMLIDNAVDLVTDHIPSITQSQAKTALLDAQKKCFEVGLTTVADCGLDYQAVNLIDSLQKTSELKMRMYVMLSDKAVNFEYLFKKGAIKTDALNVRSFKVYADGALGSRGACLLEPYADKHGYHGFLLSDKKHFANVATKIFDKGFQMCTHAIGDSANREILNVYEKVLKGKNDLRWRIEHAQVVSPQDFKRFGQFSIIPSVQATHATSDMYWAADRLGQKRLKGAYAYKELLDQNGWLVLGTDFPVEQINPLLTFYSAVFRKDKSGYPAKGFQLENALTREETLRGMTIWAAKGNFEEKEKGSLEKGKFADFVILDQDIMSCAPESVLSAKVISTFLNGERVYGKAN